MVSTTFVERTCTAVVLYRFPEPPRVAVWVIGIRKPDNSDVMSILHDFSLLEPPVAPRKLRRSTMGWFSYSVDAPRWHSRPIP